MNVESMEAAGEVLLQALGYAIELTQVLRGLALKGLRVPVTDAFSAVMFIDCTNPHLPCTFTLRSAPSLLLNSWLVFHL